uniref:protein unc-93 homolog A n=1 Tax=Myodes glareolus TaxID=447135 RepID=UPI00202100DA|nr:protein unc-93 homolog A [Myodes glareolus]
MGRNLKNVLVVSCGFFLLFTAYGGLQNLQSSLYNEDGLGVATLSTIYCTMMLSSMFLPPVLIKRFGCKWTMVGSMCCYVTFSLANFYPDWHTLIPTSVLLGLGAAPLWSAQCTYITIMGSLQAQKEGKLAKDVVNQYFGLFFLIFQSSGMWGNLISSLVFSQAPSIVAISEDQLKSCGAKDCLMDTEVSNSTYRPSHQLIYTLLGIFNGSSVLAILLVSVLLESVEDRMASEGQARPRSSPLWSTVLSTFVLFKDKRLCLLMLLPLYSGLHQGFLYGEYTKSYATCALGIHFVGYVMICFSAVTSLCSLLCGKISKYTGRAALYVTALYGVLFEEKKEAAFANYRLGEALGFVIAFGYSSFLCVRTKLYILLSILSLTITAYGAVEYLESRAASEGPPAGEENEAGKEEMKTEI